MIGGMTSRAAWSQAEDALLRERVLEGATNQAIGDELDRSASAVRSRRKSLGMPTGISRSEGRARALRIAELAGKGWSDRDIAKALGEAHATIQKARQRADVRSAPQRIKWTSLRVEVVAALMGDGVRPSVVDRSLGLRAGSTQRQLNRWGIGTDLAAGDIRDALLLVNMRARGMSDPEICSVFGWLEIPQQCLNVGRRPGARADVTWTTEENQELRRLTAAGRPTSEIAATVGRSAGSVSERRIALGLGRPGARRWTAHDSAQLETLYGSGGDDASIARALDRSAQSIGMRRLQLGLLRKKRWSSEDDATVAVLAAAGSTTSAIVARLGWSRETVRQRRNALGLPARGRGTPWTPEQDSLLLRLQALGRSYSEIGMELGRSEAAVARRAREIKG
jgi:DNA-binding NarL/FixJ family response regulator